jgi:hypothetical protein
MRLIRVQEAARKLGIDGDKIRRDIRVDQKGREYFVFDGMRLTVYRQGILGRRLFDADEIAWQLVQRAKRKRLGS